MHTIYITIALYATTIAHDSPANKIITSSSRGSIHMLLRKWTSHGHKVLTKYCKWLLS